MQLNWSFPYSSRRAPILARNVVASSQPLATQAGLQMLQNGGNAVDAALAAAICLAVVEPTMNGLGGDAFALVWAEGKLEGLNASGRSPQRWTPEHFGRHTEMPEYGWESVTTPGCVSSWVSLSDKFGRLPFKTLFEPAITYARQGFHVTVLIADLWERSRLRYASFPDFQETFCPSGRAPLPGELFRCPAQAETLSEIAETRGESFYRGRLASLIAKCSRKAGALLDEQDLSDHVSFPVEPISIDYREYRLHEIPPNGQGIAALIALGILRHFDLSSLDPDSSQCLHLQIEATKLALADVHRWVSDPATMLHVMPDHLLNEGYLAKRAALLDPGRAIEAESGSPAECDTVYLTAADESGMMVSFIQSNYYGFGSGAVVPGTGISLQNRGCGFSLEEGHPNRVAGGKLPFHTIIPGFVTRGGLPVMSFGVMGGPMQAQGHVQMMVRLADFAQNPQAASDAPRWKVLGGLRVALERGTPQSTIEDLRERGHAVEVCASSEFGGAQLIATLKDGYVGASDHRKDGLAAGY